jgi:hypothetical protein
VTNNQSQELNEMQIKIHLSGIAVVASMLIILASGCASPAVEPASSKTPAAVIAIEQPPMTSYMRSQIGTPNELSPLAPAEARNVRKDGNRWRCDLHGQGLVFNEASSCWEPQTK